MRRRRAVCWGAGGGRRRRGRRTSALWTVSLRWKPGERCLVLLGMVGSAPLACSEVRSGPVWFDAWKQDVSQRAAETDSDT